MFFNPPTHWSTFTGSSHPPSLVVYSYFKLLILSLHGPPSDPFYSLLFKKKFLYLGFPSSLTTFLFYSSISPTHMSLTNSLLLSHTSLTATHTLCLITPLGPQALKWSLIPRLLQKFYSQLTKSSLRAVMYYEARKLIIV